MTKKHIGIIVFDQVLTSEIIAPAEVFGIAAEKEWFNEWTVTLVGVEPKPTIVTAEGIPISVTTTIDEPILFDVLIIPGAYDMAALFQNENLNAFIKKHEEEAQYISSNCSGAFLLAHSGVLDGAQATTWFGGEAQLQEQFPQVQVVFDSPVVVDNRRVTSNGGLVSYQAALILLGKLSSPARAQEVFNALNIGRLDDWSVIEKSMA